MKTRINPEGGYLTVDKYAYPIAMPEPMPLEQQEIASP
jgi:hypothetical protein